MRTFAVYDRMPVHHKVDVREVQFKLRLRGKVEQFVGVVLAAGLFLHCEVDEQAIIVRVGRTRRHAIERGDMSEPLAQVDLSVCR